MTLAVEQAGTGIPLVFLHAFPLDRRMWANMSSFSKNFRMITLDFPGFGGSPLSAQTARMDWMAREAASTLEGVGVREPAVFVGLSMGGYVLLQMARLFPEKIRASAFISTKTGADTPEVKEKRTQNISMVDKDGVIAFAAKSVEGLLGATSHAERPDVVNEVRTLIQGQSKAAITAALRGMAERTDTGTVLEGLTRPAIFIAGAEDEIIKPTEMEAMAKRAKNSEFHVVEKAGHLLNFERPDVLENLLSHFLKRRVL